MRIAKLFVSSVFVLCCGACVTSREFKAQTNRKTAAAPNSSPKICNVTDSAYGAKGDGVTVDTAAINAAINDCASAGGGIVTLRGDTQGDIRHRTFISGTIALKSNITLSIDSSATLKGSSNESDYPLLVLQKNGVLIHTTQSYYDRALIYAQGVKNVIIDGGGTIGGSSIGATNGGNVDGNGGNPLWAGGQVTLVNGKSVSISSVHDASDHPIPVFIVSSDQVTVQGLNVNDGAISSIVAMESTNILVQNVSVHSPYSPYRDGIDIIDSAHAVVKDSFIYSEDDAICLKSGDSTGVQDVQVSNIEIAHTGSNALKLGTGSVGPMSDIHFDTINILNANSSAMAVESVGGGAINNVSFNNITFGNGSGAKEAFFLILGALSGSTPGTLSSVGSIQNISFSNVAGKTKSSWGSLISGTTEPDGSTYYPQNISFTNVVVTDDGSGLKSQPSTPAEYLGQYPDAGDGWYNLPGYGLYLRHLQGVTLQGVSFRPSSAGDARPAVVQSDVQNFSQTP